MKEEHGRAAARRLVMVDTHAHLDDDAFDADRDDVLARARDAGVEAIINVAFSEARWASTLALAHRNTGVFAALGVHPHEADAWSTAVEARLDAALRQPGVVGVGEIGLDFHRNDVARDVQRAAFSAQVQLARALDLPIVIHSRDAESEVVAMLEAAAPVRGVLHSFSGSDDAARHALSYGMHLSVTGPVTYPNGHRQRDLARVIPADRLLLETDAPYLPPQPWRGRRNEPAFLRASAEALARARGEALAQLCRHTSENARRLFRLSPAITAALD